MTEWFHVAEYPPPMNVEVLACNKDYPKMWVAFRWDNGIDEHFIPTICTCCEDEPHGFKATHWKYLPKGPK